MKRYWSMILAAALLLSLAGCQREAPSPASLTQEITGPVVSTPGNVLPTTLPTTTPQPTTPPATEPSITAPPAVDAPSTWTTPEKKYLLVQNRPNGSTAFSIPPNSLVEVLGWDGPYVLIQYGERVGYVLADTIAPEDIGYFQQCLDTVTLADPYPYEQMLLDIDALAARHPDVLTVGQLGTSELGKAIPVLQIGSLDAEHHVLVQGAMHGREHITALLVMALVDYWLDYDAPNHSDVCYHIIPMLNPDGVVISQTRTLTYQQLQIYRKDCAAGYNTRSKASYAARWKANGKGVDINRNFPAGWEGSGRGRGPSSEQYRGTAPFTCAESIALRDYTLRYPIDATVSYHASDCLIYYEYGSNQVVNALSKSLAEAVGEASGYTLHDSTGINAGGYKDWAIDQLHIPSLTMEIGYGELPLPEDQIYSTFIRNIGVFPAIAQWLRNP